MHSFSSAQRSAVTRRRFLRAGAASAIGAAFIGLDMSNTAAAAAPDTATDTDAFAGLRSAWATMTSGGAINAGNSAYTAAISALNSSAQTCVQHLINSSGRTQLFDNLPFGSSSATVTHCFTNLETMALAYVTPGTSYTGSDSLLEDIVSGLDFMVSGPYSPSVPDTDGMHGYDNWWDWQIGSPQALQDTANLVYSGLSAAQIDSYCSAIDYFVPDPTTFSGPGWVSESTGTTRIDLCRVVIVRGALAEAATKITQGTTALAPTLAFITSGDGLYNDGSFVEHFQNGSGLAYTGAYGDIWLYDLSLLLGALAGSPWAVTDPNVANVIFAATSAFAPVCYNGLMMDAVRGRTISRPAESDASNGLACAVNLIRLAPAASTASLTQELKSIAKGWLQRCPRSITTPNSVTLVSGGASLAPIVLGGQLLIDSSVPAAPEPINHTLFPGMDRAVHRRSGWTVTISMASDRIAWYESLNGENLHGWHTGDGMTYTYLDSDNTQYGDAFWPTVNPYRLPGITASLLPLADGQNNQPGHTAPSASFVGGTTDGEFASIAQDLKGPFSTLVAKKSWFCLNDAVICMGSGITCTDGTEVDTVIDSRNLGATGTNTLLVDGRRQPASQGWTHTFPRRTHWAQLDGQSGYVFPADGAVTALREQRSGTWSDIEGGASQDTITRNYVTLLFNHGTNPINASYLYLLMPGATRSQVAQRAADHAWMHVLANTNDQHAVAVPALGVTAANFWRAGRVGLLSLTAPVCVLIREHRDGTATICVADPARVNTGLTLTWDRPVREVISQPASVTSISTGHQLQIVYSDLSQLVGSTQEVRVRLR